MTSRSNSAQATIAALAVALAFIAVSQCERHGFSIDTRATGGGDGGSAGEFVATSEWQTVQPGQKIPPGLHVRMNIQTGETEARLMMEPVDADGESKKNLPVLVESHQTAEAEAEAAAVDAASERLRAALASKEVKEALKKIKAENLPDEDSAGANAKQFRTYEELKADFAKLNANVKTDLEIIKGLLADWGHPTVTDADRLRILGDLEYHLRQIDNGQNFVQLNGLDLLLGLANATAAVNPALTAAALRVLAASCQGNTPVQVAAVKAGFLPVLLRLLEHSTDGQLRSLGVLAVASLCRNFPHAQALLFKSGGLSALRTAFSARDADHHRRALRIVTLLADFALEAVESPEGSERRRQYELIGAARVISETGWCQTVAQLLAEVSGEGAGGNGHDSIEKTVVAMETLTDACRVDFAGDGALAKAALTRLEVRYAAAADAEAEDEEGGLGYFAQLRDRIRGLRLRLMTSEAPPVAGRTEL